MNTKQVNNQLVKVAAEHSLTVNELIKVAYDQGFEIGVRKVMGDQFADSMVKQASEYTEQTGRDYVEDLIAEILN